MKTWTFLLLMMLSVLGRGYEVVVTSPDKSEVTIVSSTTTKMATLKARRASKTQVAMTADSDINRVSLQILAGGNYEVSYNRGTQVGTFKVERATRLVPADFQPPVPGEIIGAKSANGVITWTFSAVAVDAANGAKDHILFRAFRQ